MVLSFYTLFRVLPPFLVVVIVLAWSISLTTNVSVVTHPENRSNDDDDDYENTDMTDNYSGDSQDRTEPKKKKKVHGRFLQFTDAHEDPLYVVHSNTSLRCHRGVGKAGLFGYRGTSCDCPYKVTDAALDFIGTMNKASGTDFVIWTGDTARHDRDPLAPFSVVQSYQMNLRIAGLLEGLDVPVIPSVGNNDVFPHNMMDPAPNDMLDALANAWQGLLSVEEVAAVRAGGYYTREVLPGKLTVVALNTQYLTSTNTAVEGCSHEGSPGRVQMAWLADVLHNVSMGKASHRVIISGHIPPSSTMFSRNCFRQYLNLTMMYQDIISGHVFAHLHTDQFWLLEPENTISPSDAIGAVLCAPSLRPTFNPSLRWFVYDKHTLEFTDYEQWFAEFDDANESGVMTFQLEYSLSANYGMSSANTSAFIDLTNRMNSNRTVMDQYIKYKTVSTVPISARSVCAERKGRWRCVQQQGRI